ncbi:IS1595 family transposase [Paracraurococcus lichenis]|uniref:IS1595 family transposase n=1 Tax=Paracraurococcus lichenis TaxID=3064888 RepID=A0ABT9EEC4_9PROT|nr:IS1595 family transposase [Paracraurococcus sp. LOR1-02]MDO9714365.1 IS1595 family transposase [Paracraurococcus sp. LOR1-02]
MLERDAKRQLTGRVELDNAYLGGKRGRGSPGKTPFLAAVETTPEGKPVRLKMCRVPSFCSRAVEDFAKRGLERTCEVISDGLPCFVAMTKTGCRHTVIRTGSGAQAVRTPAFKWVNAALGNMKAASTSTYRSIAPKHVPVRGNAPNLRRVSVPLQPPLRPGRHAAAPRYCRVAGVADALPPSQAG